MGIMFPLILGAVLVAALVLAVLRWRRGTQQTG